MGTKTPQKFPANLAGKRRPNVEVRSGCNDSVEADSGDDPPRWWSGWDDGEETSQMGPATRLEVAGSERTWPEKEGREGERVRGERGWGRGERKVRGFSWKGNPKNTQKGNFPKIPLQLPLTITLAYELRFTCTSCLRTRFNTIYNFREETLFKFQTLQKVNSWTP